MTAEAKNLITELDKLKEMDTVKLAKEIVNGWDDYDTVLDTALRGATVTTQDLARELCAKWGLDPISDSRQVIDEIEKTCRETVIAEALVAIPDDYEFNWTMFWESDDEQEATTTRGPDWAKGIPDGPNWSNARERAGRYSEYVSTAVRGAKRSIEECRKALEVGDLGAAREAVKQGGMWCYDTTYQELARVFGLDLDGEEAW